MSRPSITKEGGTLPRDTAHSDLMNGIVKLRKFGMARDRTHEPTGRDVVLTDDEAVAILRQLPNALVRAATDPDWNRPTTVLPTRIVRKS